MTEIRLDPAQLEGMSSLLDSTAGEYEALGGMLANPDLGSMPPNVAGAVGQAYLEVRSILSGLAAEFAAEASTLRFRSATALEQGGLGAHLGVFGGIAPGNDAAAAWVSPLGAAGFGGALACCWSGVLVGVQGERGSPVALDETSFMVSDPVGAAGTEPSFSSDSLLIGGDSGGGSTFVVGGSSPGFQIFSEGAYGPSTITIGGPETWWENYVSVIPPGDASIVTIGGTGPWADFYGPGPSLPNTITIGGTSWWDDISTEGPTGPTTIMVGGPGPTWADVQANPGAYSPAVIMIAAMEAGVIATDPFTLGTVGNLMDSHNRGVETWLAPSGHSYSWTGSGERMLTNTSPYYDSSTGLYPGGSRPG